jgi:hypothetical protein
LSLTLAKFVLHPARVLGQLLRQLVVGVEGRGRHVDGLDLDLDWLLREVESDDRELESILRISFGRNILSG